MNCYRLIIPRGYTDTPTCILHPPLRARIRSKVALARQRSIGLSRLVRLVSIGATGRFEFSIKKESRKPAQLCAISSRENRGSIDPCRVPLRVSRERSPLFLPLSLSLAFSRPLVPDENVRGSQSGSGSAVMCESALGHRLGINNHARRNTIKMRVLYK